MLKFIDTKNGYELNKHSAYYGLCKKAWGMAEKGQLTTFNGDLHFAFRCDDAAIAQAVSYDIQGDSVDMYANPETREVWGYAFEVYTEEWLPVVRVEEVE